MRLRGIYFPPICSASGAQGFYGEGYPFHRVWKYFGMTFENCGLTAKTVTLHPRAGNMSLRTDNGVTPTSLFPDCIRAYFLKGVMLNAVGLSNPGLEHILNTRRWHAWPDPFFVSFMSLMPTKQERLDELSEFVRLLKPHVTLFTAPVGLEMNVSCPNDKHINPSDLVEEVGQMIDIAGRLYIPLQVKYNALAPVEAVCETASHPSLDAIVMGNTIPWGALPKRIDWKGLFDSNISPLAHLGGGGLSGWPLFPIHCDWIRTARDNGMHKPIWLCGGIMSAEDIAYASTLGDTIGFQIGAVNVLRPWRTKSIIHSAYRTF